MDRSLPEEDHAAGLTLDSTVNLEAKEVLFMDLNARALNSICSITDSTDITAAVLSSIHEMCGPSVHAFLVTEPIMAPMQASLLSVSLTSGEADETTTVILKAKHQGSAGLTFQFDVPSCSTIPLLQLRAIAAAAGASHRVVELLDSARIRQAFLEVAHLGQHADSETPNEILKRIIALSHEVMESDRVSLFLVDEAKRELYCVASTAGMKQVFHEPFGTGIAGTVAVSRCPLRVADVSKEVFKDVAAEVDVLTELVTGPVLAVPIMAPFSKQLLAVLVVVRVPTPCSTRPFN
jgi:hypothetical protein